MKKIIYSIFVFATVAMSLMSCEDVPMPYATPSSNKDSVKVVTPVGSGIQADPFNVAAANAYISDGEGLDKDVYTKGVITAITELDASNYGNATYYIADDPKSSTKLEVYRGYSLGNKKFKSEDEISVGDTVIVCGKLINYNGTYEYTQGNYIYSLNGKTSSEGGGGTTVTGKGSVDSPYTVSDALTLIKNGSYTSDKVYISGIVSNVGEVNTSFGNATYYISDDGKTTTQLEVYRGYGLGGEKFASETDIKAGDKVVVYGVLTYYNSKTPEVTTGSQIYSLNGKTSGGDNTGGGTTKSIGTLSGNVMTVTLNDLGLDNAAAVTSATLTDGTTITFDKGDGTNAPAFYTATKGVRMYAKNTLTIKSSKKITSVKLDCDKYNNVEYVGNEQLYGQAGSTKIAPTKNGTVVTFTPIDNSSFLILNDFTGTSGGTQLRIVTMTITYAE